MRANQGFGLLILLIVMLSALALTRADARIVVGVSTVNVAFLPIYVTQDKGFFKDEGLDVLVVMFNAGATNLQALIGGDVQIMAGGVPETVLARASGADIKNFWAISNLMPFQIYGNPGFKSLKDSKGKKFAISRFGSLSEFLTRSSIRHFGADPKEATLLQIGATPARFTALASGSVDAAVLWFPVTERAKAMGFRFLFDLKEIYPEWSNVGFIAREPWLAKEKEQTIKFLTGFSAGREAHPRESGRWHRGAAGSMFRWTPRNRRRATTNTATRFRWMGGFSKLESPLPSSRKWRPEDSRERFL